MLGITAPKKPAKKRNNLLLAYIALTFVTLIWALAGPVIKLTLEDIPPMHFLFFRLLMVCLILLPTLLLQLKKDPVESREIPTLIVLGLLSQSSLALTFLGYQYATALEASIITLISPILCVAAGHYYYNEKVTKSTKIGVILASAGTFLIIVEPLLTNSTTMHDKQLHVLGNLLILVATLSFLVYTLWSKFAAGEKSKRIAKAFKFLHLKRLKKGRSDLIITFVTFYVGLASLIPLVYLESKGTFGAIEPFYVADLTPLAIAGIGYMAIFSSIVAYTLFEWALNVASVGDTAFFNYLSPIFTFPFAYLLLSEIPTKINLIGAAIIGAGVVIAERKKSRYTS